MTLSNFKIFVFPHVYIGLQSTIFCGLGILYESVFRNINSGLLICFVFSDEVIIRYYFKYNWLWFEFKISQNFFTYYCNLVLNFLDKIYTSVNYYLIEILFYIPCVFIMRFIRFFK